MPAKNSLQTKSTGHSALGPSSAKRWFNCPGSINLIASLPPEAFKQSKYAAEGTIAHMICEDYIEGKTSLLRLMDRVGETISQSGFEIEIIEDMVNGAVEYEAAGNWAREQLTKPILIEDSTEIRVHALSVDEAVYGTADRVIYQKGHILFVIDYKFGKGVVEVEDNEQLLTYAIAVMDGVAGWVFNKVVLGIVQPRAHHPEGTTRWVEFTIKEVQAFREELINAVTRTKDQHALRVAGPWCRFCPALAYCAEAQGAVEKTTQTLFTKLPVPVKTGTKVDTQMLPDPNKFTSEQLAKALDWKPLIEVWFEAIKARAIAELMREPGSVPGWKIVQGRKNRVWKEESYVKANFEQLLGERAFAPRKLLSPAQMEKIAGKEEVAKHVIIPEGEPSLVPETDNRPAILNQKQVEEIFQPVSAKITPASKSKNEEIFGDLFEAPEKGPLWPE
jgi:Protein of unknown function (DUF2800)